ncbi:unnamed protein product [Paramecium sonneborni]|uniref:Uncharacterized protein n=1 Tax=Paramecium sonneborni TaxID=65129 RepID=A0A8S1RDI5_9CILI|nr:unnamed protein product [Paramecium sonneborni]
MNHEAESTPLIQQEYQAPQSNITEQEQPKIVSMNQILLQNTAQAFSPAIMISKQFYVFSKTIKKSIEQYRNNESIQFVKNMSSALEEYDGVSYSNDALNQDQSITAKGIKYFSKAISKIRSKLGVDKKEQEQQEQGAQQQNRNESLIPEQSQRIDEEHI